MNQVPSKQNLWEQCNGAILWGFFLILAPFEVLLFGAVLWLPLLIWRERTRSRRNAFWPGALCRFAVVLVMVLLAIQAPCKKEDRHVGLLRDRDTTLADLAAAKVIYPLMVSSNNTAKVTLPSANPTFREVMHAITQQTGLRTHLYHCGNGSTILFGSGGGAIRVSEPR